MKYRLLSRSLATLTLSCLLAAAPTAYAKDTVKLAFIGPLTGGSSAIGLGGRNSADLAVKLRNSDPQTKYNYQLVALDDECKANIGVQVATKAASDKSIVAGITNYCSEVAISSVDVYSRFGLPVVVWGAVLPDIIYGKKLKEIHRINGTMINQNQAAAAFMNDQGYKKWVIIHDTTDYGKGHNEYFSKYIQELGGEIVGTFGVMSDQQDFTAELTRVKELDPEVIYLGVNTAPGIRLRSQMDRLGLNAQPQGTSGIMSDAYIEGLGADLAEGTLAFLEGAPLDKLPRGKEFSDAYQKQGYSQAPDAYGPFAYAATDLVIDIIEEVGPDRTKILDRLGQVQDVDTIIGPVTFDEHGQNIVPLVSKYVVQDGKWVIWEDSEYAQGKRTLKGL